MDLTAMKQLLGNTTKPWLLAIVGGALISMLGLSVLFGWYTHNVPLIQVSAAFVPMQFNTALAFLLSGLGLLLILRGHHRAGMACGIFVMLLGMLTLVQYIFGIDLGIDQLLMEHYITVQTSSPGRMAPNTALCFSLTGAALAVIGAKVWRTTLVTSVLASLVVGLGFAALSGYLISFESAYGWGELTRMAVHTAVGFMILGVAFVSIAWHREAPASGGLPLWLPWPIGISAAMIVLSMWQALDYNNARLIERYGSSGDFPLLTNVILATGIGFAFVLTLTVYLAQHARMAGRRLAAEIDERRLAEQKMRFTQFAVDHNADPTYWIQVDGKICYANEAACQFLGYSQEELQSMSVSEIDPDFPLAAWPEHWQEMKEAGAMTFEAHHKTKSSQVFEVEIHTSYIRHQNEEYIWAYARDITERKHAEEALLAKEHEQHEILNSMLDAVITIDETGKIISLNKTAETLFGYSFAEVVGQNIKRLMPDPYTGEHDGYLRNYLETGDAHIIGYGREVEGLRKNKETFPMRLSVAELPADETGKRRFIGTCHDLTLNKQQEEQLRRSQRMDALGKLTGGIAHDFNNMLGVVTGYAELLENMLSGQPRLADYAHEIYHAGERGAKLTKKLLSFSRLEASKGAKTDINKLLQKQQDMLQKSLTVRIKLLIDLGDDAWPVRLDSSDLEDAIINISLNAMDAMQDMESGAQLTIRTANQSLNTLDSVILGLKPGDYVRLSLADTGIGMDAATREKIFDPFFSTKGEEGTGLGLTQVFGFVKRAGGAIKVYSEPGHGSKFVLYFPRYPDDDVDEATDASEDVSDLRGKEHVLVVDDEAALLNFTSELLGRQGYRVFRAADAKQALQILEREHIDLLLSDVIMPGMDGYQLAAIVQEKYPAIKIQLASGFAETLNTGVFDKSLRQNLLEKPYNSQGLLKAIRALLNNQANHSPKKAKKTQTTRKKIIAPMEWTSTLSVGVPAIDKDHKVLVSLFNRCLEVANGTKPNKELDAILDELVDYTKYHFQREEKIMAACDYPRLNQHRKGHQRLVKEIQRHKRKYDQGELTADSLLKFLSSWLKNHILGADKAVASHIKGKENLIQQALDE